jgi:thiol-disulfide isomerase/thioredoxin
LSAREINDRWEDRMFGRRLGTGLLVVGALVLSACTATTPSATTADAPATSSPSAPPSATPEPTVTAPAPETAAPAPPAPAEGAYIEYADGIIEQTAGAKVLFFHAPWCPQCRKLDDQLVAEGAPDGLTVFKVDYDSRGDLRQRYGVTLQTTVVFVDDAGQALSSTVLYDDPSIASLLAAAP